MSNKFTNWYISDEVRYKAELAEAEAVVKYGAPKKTEWSVALGMEFALIFIYINILRILAILANRR